MTIIPIVNESNFPLPKFQTISSAGMDLRAFIKSPITISSLERAVIKTGIKIELPIGFEGQIRPRSGLALKHGITVLNSPGTIDSDYRGDISVIIINLSKKDYTISPGDRIAQIVISSYEKVNWELKNELSDSNRGDKGFGSTGDQ